MYYASRGFVCDYKNRRVVEAFTNLLTQYTKKKKGIMLKIDPCIIYQERNEDGDIVEGGFDNKEVVEHLLSLGYKHKGITLDFDGIQPRFVYKLPLDRSLDELMEKFHHKTRYNIRLAIKKGIEIIEGSREDLAEFERIMKITGERDGFITRPLSYFQDMYDVLEPKGKLKLYIAKYNVSRALEMTLETLTKELANKKIDENRITKLTNEKEELEGLVKQYPQGIIVSGTIMLVSGKKASYLYGASDNLYRNIMPNYLIQWQMICDAHKMGCTMYDFRGISGDRNPDNHLYGLYRFKRGFTGEFIEYIGEFDYVLNPLLYTGFEWGVPKTKELVRKLRK
jgi:peptidoglycan pentaglycine glycine transferase (the first glycine)